MERVDIEQVLAQIDKNRDKSLEILKELLAFPSISTDPKYSNDCKSTAKYLADLLQDIGFEASVRPTPGHPMVVAHYKKAQRSAPHLLFYGHYDVQPVDPIELWHHDPFDAQIKEINGDESIVARGASDDKGQLLTFIEACRAFNDLYGALPLNITILLEGEEESGSPSLETFLIENKDELKADYALVCDTGMWDKDTPSISLALRGMLAVEIIVKAASRDLHSGEFGGAAANPINILCKALGDLKDDSGRVQIPGFYDGVYETPSDVLDVWNKLGCDEKSFLSPVGLSKIYGEKDRTLLETVWARPTADVNGIIGGYTGDGFKTVIASEARAKVSFRLVHDQDPHKISQELHNFIKQRVPSDCQVQVIDHGGSKAISLPADLPFIQKAKKALSDEWKNDAILVSCGGSIPVVGDFQRILDMQSLLIGFALDDNIHSPNEKYSLRSYFKGQRSWARVMVELAK